jgi:hypothetical protein
MDSDWNRYDTFHPVVDHPHMSRATWSRLYRDAWDDFYSLPHLAAQLARAPHAQQTTLLQLYLWYRTAAAVEGAHPMMTGFFRLKPRTDRRPGFAVDGRLRHSWRRIAETWTTVRGYATVLRELESAWEAARHGSSVTVDLTAPPRSSAAAALHAAYGMSRQLRLHTEFVRTMCMEGR